MIYDLPSELKIRVSLHLFTYTFTYTFKRNVGRYYATGRNVK